MKNKGFTLVELAIVLVIIGLLVGGVLQGQELIKQAQIRNVLASLREYDTAVNTFRSKYNNGLPGDFNKATTFGLCATGTCNATANTFDGNGNGLLEDLSGTTATNYTGELANFYLTLLNASLVKATVIPTTGTIDVGEEFPSSPVGVGVIAVSYAGNLYYLTGLNGSWANTALQTTASATSALGNSLTPEEAYSIDSKIDDGRPNAGIVHAISAYRGLTTVPTAAASTATTNCSLGALLASDYRLANKTKSCSLYVRASS